MSNFKKYMSVIQEMKVLPGLKDKINKFNFNDIYGNKIPGRVIIDSDILLLDLHATTGEDGLLIIKNKEGKEITPEKIDILIKLGKKWLSIYDTHVQSSLAERHKKLNSNQVLRMTNIDFTNNVMSMKNKESTSLPVSPASDFFMPFSINYFVDKYNDHNSFFEMNPSLHIDTEGNVVILIRNIIFLIIYGYYYYFTYFCFIIN